MEDFKKPSSAEPNTNFEPKNTPIGPRSNPFKPKPISQSSEHTHAEPTLPVNSNPTPQAKPPKSTGLAIGLICCAIAAAAGLGLGIFNLLQNNSLSSSINAQNATIANTQKDIDELKASVAKLIEENSDTGTVEVKCIAPTSVDDIWSVQIQNGPNSEFYINPGSNEIRYISYTQNGNEETSTNKTVITNAADIIQHIYDNTKDSLVDDDFANENYNWYISVDGNSNSSCMIAGQDTPPAWFDTLITMLEAKRGN